MALRSKKLLKELIEKHQDWNWESLEEQAFVEIMLVYRHAPEEDQNSVVLSFTLVKEFIRRYLLLKEQERLRFTPQKLVFKSKLYNAGFQAGIKELQLRNKSNKTRIEKKYVEIADKFNIDIETVSIIWGLVNGYHRTQEQIVIWAKRQYPRTRLLNHPEFYRWLALFLEDLSSEDFALFYEKPIEEKPIKT